jgi:protease I
MKALIILIPEGFRDEEFSVPKETLISAGVSVTVAGLRPGEAVGKLGLRAVPDIQVEEVKSDDYDAIIIPGGGGTERYLYRNPIVLKLVREFNEKKKIVASICLGGAVLCYAGVLGGKKATVFATPETMRIFTDKKVTYKGDGVFIDGNIVTASGPEYAQEFAEAIVLLLKDKSSG